MREYKYDGDYEYHGDYGYRGDDEYHCDDEYHGSTAEIGDLVHVWLDGEDPRKDEPWIGEVLKVHTRSGKLKVKIETGDYYRTSCNPICRTVTVPFDRAEIEKRMS